MASVLINPVLPRLGLRPFSALPYAVETNTQASAFPETPREHKAKRAEGILSRTGSTTPVLAEIQVVHSAPTHLVAPANNVEKPVAIGFYVNWDDSSYESLKRNLGQLDWVVPEWLRLQDGDDPLIRDVDPKALDLIRRTSPKTPIIPMLHNSTDGVWDTNVLVRAIADD